MIEYRGYLIAVRPSYVVTGEDPMGEATPGFVGDIRTKDAVQDDPDGHVLYDFPFDPATSFFQGATEDEVIAKAKAFIDARGKSSVEPVPRDSDE
jgi:hypothetical protein